MLAKAKSIKPKLTVSPSFQNVAEGKLSETKFDDEPLDPNYW
jgi:hypothetical protein